MREHLQEVETPTGPQLSIYANRSGAIVWALGSVALGILVAVIARWLIADPRQSPNVGLFYVLTIIAKLFFGRAGLYYGYWAITPRPLLSVNAIGIVDYGSTSGFGLLRWEEIAGLQVFVLETDGRGVTVSRRAYLCITVYNQRAVTGRLPHWKRLVWWLSLWRSRAPSPILIPQTLLADPAQVVCARIVRLDTATPAFVTSFRVAKSIRVMKKSKVLEQQWRRPPTHSA